MGRYMLFFCLVFCRMYTIYGQEVVAQEKDSFKVKMSMDVKYLDDLGYELSEKQFNDSLALGTYSVAVSDGIIKLKRKYLSTSKLIGSILPSITYADIKGEEHKIGDMTNPALIVIWDKTCAPCYNELVELNNLAPKYPTIRFYALTVDTKEDVESFMEKRGTKLNNLTIIPKYEKDYQKLLNTSVVPVSILIDSAQKIQYIGVGNNVVAIEKAIILGR